MLGDCHSSFAPTGVGCDRIIAATGISATPVFTTECPPNWERLGFDCVLDAPKAVQQSAVTEDFTMEMRSYYYTVVNRMGWESMPSVPSYWARYNVGGKVTVGGFTVPPNAVHIRIYRAQTPVDWGTPETETSNLQAVYLKVGEIDAGTPTFVDDVIVAGEACVSECYQPPPRDLRELCSWREGRLAGLSGDCLVISERGLPHAWNDRFRVTFYDKPIALKCADRKAYVLTDGRPAVVEILGDCEENAPPVRVTEIPFVLPIVSRRSAAIFATGVVYASYDGLVFINGTDATIITKDYYTPDQWQALLPHTMIGIVHDGHYYGATDTTTIRFRLPDTIFANAENIALTTISYHPKAFCVNAQGYLYLMLDDGIYQWDSGKAKLPYRWKGRVSESDSVLRLSAFRIRTSNNVTVSHWINTRMVQHLDNVGNDAKRLPVGKHGQDFQVEVRGIGEVSSYIAASSVYDLISD